MDFNKITIDDLTKPQIIEELKKLEIKFSYGSRKDVLFDLLKLSSKEVVIEEPIQEIVPVEKPIERVEEVKETTTPKEEVQVYRASYEGKAGRIYLLGNYTDQSLIAKDYSRKGGKRLIVEEL